MNTRPTGLTVFSVINFIFAALSGLGLIARLASSQIREVSGIELTPYSVLSPLVTTLLLIISGVGFLRVNYKFGFIGGITFGAFALLNILYFNILTGFENFALHIPSMIYPTVVLLMLTLKYKQTFTDRNCLA